MGKLWHLNLNDLSFSIARVKSNLTNQKIADQSNEICHTSEFLYGSATKELRVVLELDKFNGHQN